ncbi:hypothetical protein CR513_53370, partial [Mucuna pruriens]
MILSLILYKFDMIFIKGKDFWDHVDGNTPAPNRDQDNIAHAKWEIKDARVMPWILVNNDYQIQFSQSSCLVQDQYSGKIIAKDPKIGRLFPIHFLLSPNLSLPLVSCNSAIVDYQVWDKRLGHSNSNVVLGNKQEYRLNYDETFAPVVKMTTVCIILALMTSQSWSLHQMDVKNAFLHGDLKEEVYIKLPYGFITSAIASFGINIWSNFQQGNYGQEATLCSQ